MGRKILLFIGAAHCHVCTWQNGELSAAKRFAGDTGGREQFAAFLRAHRAPALLLADLVEEDFHHEAVPHLRGGERTALIRRKLEQYYRDTPFRMAVTLQRRKEGRRDDDMLFSALTHPALISPWLDIMLAHNVALGGIYSIPHLCAPLLQAAPSARLLLLSWEKHAGLRQTYFDAGMLRLSRLSPLNGNGSFAGAAATETARTQQYLKNLGLLPHGSALDVHVICHAADRGELEASLSGSADLRFAWLDIQELGKRTGSEILYADSDATPLFLHLLAARPPRSHYAAAEHTRFSRLSHVRRALLGLSATIAAGSMLWTAADIMEGMALEEEVRALKAQTTGLMQRMRTVVQRFPDTLAPASDMKAAVILSRKLDDMFPPPQIMLEGLAETLDVFPDIRLTRLSWQNGAEEASASGVESAPAPVQVILLDGEVEGFDGNYRAALDRLDGFRQALVRQGYAVTVLSLPLDVSPQGSIAAGMVNGGNHRARFTLKIFRRAAT